MLDACVQRALKQNQTSTRYAPSKQANARISAGDRKHPTVSLSANANLSPTDSLGFGMGFQIPQSDDAPKSFSTGQAALFDLFGQNGSLIYAADRDARATADIQRQAYRTTGTVAGAYWDVV